MWCKEIYSLILCKEISLEGKNVMSNRKRAQSETYVSQMNNNTNNVKNKRSGLNIFYFLLSFLFSFQFSLLYSIFRTSVRVRVTKPCCHTAGHIR